MHKITPAVVRTAVAAAVVAALVAVLAAGAAPLSVATIAAAALSGALVPVCAALGLDPARIVRLVTRQAPPAEAAATLVEVAEALEDTTPEPKA